MSNNQMIEWTFEVDQEIYNSACAVCNAWGTTIEAMTTAFILFSVKPDNLPLIEAFLTQEADAEARACINQQIFQAVLEIALTKGADKIAKMEISQTSRFNGTDNSAGSVQ